MRFFQFFGLAVAGFLLSACQSDLYRIKGNATGLKDGDTLFITTDLNAGIPSDTIIVNKEKFYSKGISDSTQIAMIYQASHLDHNIVFFLEPGTINIDLSDIPLKSRVSGTHTNNEWQQLNDTIYKYSMQINNIMEKAFNDTNPNANHEYEDKHVEELYKTLSKRVESIAIRNAENDLGYLITTTFPEDILSNKQRLGIVKKMPKSIRNREEIKIIETMLSKTE